LNTIKDGKERDGNGRFVSGHSGGPGRPKLEDSLTQALREVVNPQELATTLYNLAITSKYFPAAQYIYDRLEGKPKQHLEINNPLDADWLELARDFYGSADPQTTGDNEPVEAGETVAEDTDT